MVLYSNPSSTQLFLSLVCHLTIRHSMSAQIHKCYTKCYRVYSDTYIWYTASESLVPPVYQHSLVPPFYQQQHLMRRMMMKTIVPCALLLYTTPHSYIRQGNTRNLFPDSKVWMGFYFKYIVTKI